MGWQTIVVGYERDHASNRALERAAGIARDTGANLIVTSIAPLLPSGAAARGIGPFDPVDSPDVHRAELAHARELLEGYHATADFDVEVGEPAHAIVALAERRGADLIVVGTHERTFLDRLLHGSVSEGVTRQAHCDVLVVH